MNVLIVRHSIEKYQVVECHDYDISCSLIRMRTKNKYFFKWKYLNENGEWSYFITDRCKQFRQNDSNRGTYKSLFGTDEAIDFLHNIILDCQYDSRYLKNKKRIEKLKAEIQDLENENRMYEILMGLNEQNNEQTKNNT